MIKKIFGSVAIAFSPLILSGCMTMPEYGANSNPNIQLQSSKTINDLVQCNIKWMNDWSQKIEVQRFENGYMFTEREKPMIATITDAGNVRIIRIFYGKVFLDLNILDSGNDLTARFASCV